MDEYAFYVLVSRLEGEAVTEFLFGKNTQFGEAPICSQCGRFLGGRDWLPPYEVDIECFGKRVGDLAFGSDLFLVSPRFKDVYVDAKLKGLSGFHPVQILSFKNGEKMVGEKPDYLKVDVFRGDIAIDPIASGDEWEGKDTCPCCLLGNRLKRRRRIVIDERTWSGEDVFFARGAPGQLIVSNRFKKVCEANGVTNAVMIPSVHRR
jgi:hypothetical protein